MKLKAFFERYLKDEYSHPENQKAYEDFLCFLREDGYLQKKRRDLKASKYSIEEGFLTDGRSEVRSGAEENFKKDILNWIKEDCFYTWKNAIQKSRLNLEIFKEALKKSRVWASGQNRLCEKYCKFGLFREKAIELIVDAANDVKNIDNVFLIQWVGPFSSVEMCESWEKKNSISNYEYNFYFAAGIPRNCKSERYYIGKSEQKNVTSRIKDPKDPVTEVKDRLKELWIGRFSQKSHRIFLESEKGINHKFVENAEWALIYGFKQQNHDKKLINRKKITKPKNYCCIVNQWYDQKNMNRRTRRSEATKCMPGLILHYNDEDDVRIADFKDC